MSWVWEPHVNAKYRWNYEQWVGEIGEAYRGVVEAQQKGAKGDERKHTGTFLGLIRACAEKDFFFFLYFVVGHRFFNTPWHVERIYQIQDDHHMTLDLWPREFGKALALDTPIPTPRGFVKHGDLRVGDYVYGSDGSPVKIKATSPVYKTDCYKVTFYGGDTFVASGNHLWEVGKKSCTRIKGTKHKRERRSYSVVTTEWLSQQTHLPDQRFSVKVNAPVQNAEAILPIDPYVLGCWIGDGTSENASFTTSDEEIIDNIRKRGYGVHKNKGKMRWWIEDLHPRLRKAWLLKNKHIPKEYMLASEHQRVELLKGLMDTDGTVSKNGAASYSSKSESLCIQVYALTNSLGLKATMREKNGKFNGKPYKSYEVTFMAYADYPVFALTRKMDRCLPSRTMHDKYIIGVDKVPIVETSCIQVDSEDGIYLIGESFTRTHNSTIICQDFTMWQVLKDPTMTVGILSYNRSLAKSKLSAIKQTFETNKLMRAVWSHVIPANPDKESPRWSLDDGIILKRPVVLPEGTVEAWGLIEGMPTGKHFSVLMMDDLVTPGSVGTIEQINKVKEMFQMGLNIGRRGGEYRICGTIYHFADLHVELEKKGDFKVRKFPAPDEGIESWISSEELSQKRSLMGRDTYASQMLLNPIADGIRTFELSWFKTFKTAPSVMNVHIVVDPAGGKGAKNDYCVMWVVGVDYDKNMFVLDGVRDRLSLKEKWEHLLRLTAKWTPRSVGYEKYGMQGDIEYMHEKMAETGHYFTLIPLNHMAQTDTQRSATGKDRILLLQPKFEAGKIRFPSYLPSYTSGKPVDLTEVFIKEEYQQYPFPTHDDMLDCLSRMLDPRLNVIYPMNTRPQVEVKKPFDYFNLRPMSKDWRSA